MEDGRERKERLIFKYKKSHNSEIVTSCFPTTLGAEQEETGLYCSMKN